MAPSSQFAKHLAVLRAGYYFDAQSGYYYDANSGLYFDSTSQCWLAQDPATGEYQPYSAPGAASAAPAADGISSAAQAAAGAALHVMGGCLDY